jgi:hypothetical protein
MHQHFPFQGPLKFTQFGNCGLKKYHLATLAVLTLKCELQPLTFISSSSAQCRCHRLYPETNPGAHPTTS